MRNLTEENKSTSNDSELYWIFRVLFSSIAVKEPNVPNSSNYTFKSNDLQKHPLQEALRKSS